MPESYPRRPGEMHSPPRPGDSLGHMLEELEMTVTEAARRLGVARQTLNNLINNERASVSPEMAVRLQAVFGSTTGSWLRIQTAYDISQIRKREAEISKGLKRIVLPLPASATPVATAAE